MYGYQEILESVIQETLEKEGYEGYQDGMDARVSDMIPPLVDEVAEVSLEALMNDAGSMLKKRSKERRQFENRLGKLWKRPLDLLEMFIVMATEAGADFNNEYRESAVKSDDAVFEALTRLHARACQVSSAILVLLRAGYADDADARWRSLHEIAIVSSIIYQEGQELAERYLLHDTVQRYKLARAHNEYKDRINEEPISQQEFDDLEKEYEVLVARFGKPFKQEYGWAASVAKSATLAGIEKHVDLDHFRPYYRSASDNTHANSHGAYFRLGLSLQSEDVLLAGPSNMGLTEPGHAMAISLNQVTTSLLATKSNFDCVVLMKLLTKVVDEIGEAFLQVHQEMETLAVNQSDTEAIH